MKGGSSCFHTGKAEHNSIEGKEGDGSITKC